jgi:hypothetical protein
VIVAGIGFGLVLLICIDRVAGWYLNKTGYFTAFIPGVTEQYDTTEFSYSAKISSQGLRNEEVMMPKPRGVYRILAVGDSFTFGWGVPSEQSWPKVLEETLRKKDQKIEVINAGRHGSDLFDEVKICEAYADRFDVDMILVGVFSIDDLYFATLYDKEISWYQRLLTFILPTLSRVTSPVIKSAWYPASLRPGSTVRAQEYWSRAVSDYVKVLPSHIERIDPSLRGAFITGRLNPGLVDLSGIDKEYYVTYLDRKKFEASLSDSLPFLRQIQSCAGRRPMVILYLPAHVLVDKAYFSPAKKLGFSIDSRLLSLDVSTRMREEAGKLNIGFVDLVNVFRSSCRDCFFTVDSHPNGKGYAAIATAAASFVERNYLKK